MGKVETYAITGKIQCENCSAWIHYCGKCGAEFVEDDMIYCDNAHMVDFLVDDDEGKRHFCRRTHTIEEINKHKEKNNPKPKGSEE